MKNEWALPETCKKTHLQNLSSIYEHFGACCNVCKFWWGNEKTEPCKSCTGGITDAKDFSKFEVMSFEVPNVEVTGRPTKQLKTEN